jgi:competence protein ComEA
VLRRLAVAQALARGTAAEPGPAGAGERRTEPAHVTGGARWLLRPASAVAVIVLVVLVAGAGWWLSRPSLEPVPYAGAEDVRGGSTAGAVTAVTTAGETPGETAVPGDAQGASPDPASGPGTASGVGGEDAGASTSDGSGLATIEVHVVGAVRRPGLVTVVAGARVGDAVLAAGGLARRADQRAVNLARILADGEQVVVPRRGEGRAAGVEAPASSGGTAQGTGLAPAGTATGTATGSDAGSVDLNTADLAALDTLPGIGPALAQRIVDWREQNGSFTTVEQLMEVSGIGEATFARLRDLVGV